jgi:hypothetical protein
VFSFRSFDSARFLVGNYNGANFRKVQFSGLIQIFFKSQDFFSFVLQQQLTKLDFVSYCGGSLGLFLGFSAVSAIEIVYYFTLKIICVKKQERKTSSVEHDNEPVKNRNYLSNFLANSSVHGCNQVTMEKRYGIERIIWVVFVALMIYYCASVVQNFIDKYKDAPVMMKYENSLESLKEIPFPAITFINENFMNAHEYTMLSLYSRIRPTYKSVIKRHGERFSRLIVLQTFSFCWIFSESSSKDIFATTFSS